MRMGIGSACLAAFGLVTGPAFAQNGSAADDIQQGHRLALAICGYCHIAADDQRSPPILQPPAPSFASIAQRPGVSAESLRLFLSTTHGGDGAAKGMPSPELLDNQIRQVSAYLLSLRKKP